MDTQIRLMDCCPAGNNVGGSRWRKGCHLAIHNDHLKHSARLKSKITCQIFTYQILPFLHAVIVYKVSVAIWKKRWLYGTKKKDK